MAWGFSEGVRFSEDQGKPGIGIINEGRDGGMAMKIPTRYNE